MAQWIRREESANASLRKRHIAQERTIRALERQLAASEAKGASHGRELRKLRSELTRKERELRGAKLRAELPIRAISSPQMSCVESTSRRSPLGSSMRAPGGSSPLSMTGNNHLGSKELSPGADRATKSFADLAHCQGDRPAALSSKPSGKSDSELAKECEQLRNTVACQEQDLQRAASEIEVLAFALEQRAEDLGVDGNLKSGLLYQVGMFQKQAHKARHELSRRDSREKAVRKELEKSLRECDSLRTQVAQLAEERGVILDYLTESSANTARLQERVEALTREKEQATMLAQRATASEREASARLDKALSVRQVRNVVSKDIVEFESMLRETHAELVVSAANAENAKLKQQVARLAVQLEQAEITVKEELEAGEEAEAQVAKFREQLREAKEQGKLRQAKAVEALDSKIQNLEKNLSGAKGFTGGSDANCSEGEVRERNEQGVGSSPPPPKNVGTENDQKFRHERLQGMLHVANRAREIAEADASRLEVENAKLVQKLRSLDC